jgi:hypothetical protein
VSSLAIIFIVLVAKGVKLVLLFEAYVKDTARLASMSLD